MKIFVTGGSGHLGSNLVRRLLKDGHEIVAFALSGANNLGLTEGLEGQPVTIVHGDLRDRASIDRAIAGCEVAFHTAAMIATRPGGEQAIYDVNVVGTRNVLAAAKQAGVRRVVVTGSFSAVGHLPERPSNENDRFYPFQTTLPYERSKAWVEHEVLRAVAEGQDVLIATSCAIIGGNDYVPSRMGRLIRDFANQKVRAYVPGGFEFVAARDIADGHVLAMEKGRTGQKYILSTEFCTVDRFVEICERVTGKKRPPLRLPHFVMLPIAHVTSFILAKLKPEDPQRLTPGAIRILAQHRKADTTKARTELGYQPTSIESAVKEAYEFFGRRGDIAGYTGPRA
ncbi:MAG: NAD-dependent epimerase/dehydratase family protein [Polyangia bacterium]